jgi:hypothetical protein
MRHMNPYDEKNTGVGERRRSTRRDADLHLTVRLDTHELQGQAENISTAGVFFFSREQLKVTVRIEQDGHAQSYDGKLVRVERLSPETTGFAIEFDRV